MACVSLLVLLITGTLSARIELTNGAKARELELENEWTKDLQPASPETKIVKRQNGIQRVIGLLKKMKSELEVEAANEGEIYDKMICWCETNEKEKTKAIADGKARDAALVEEIAERSAARGRLDTNIEYLKKQIAKDEAALKEATVLAESRAGEGRDEEVRLVQAIANLKNAVSVLAPHNSASFVQLDAQTVLSMRTVLRDAAFQYEMILGDRPKRDILDAPLKTAFLQQSNKEGAAVTKQLLDALDTSSKVPVSDDLPLDMAVEFLKTRTPRSPTALLQAPAGFKSYNSQSGGIFGILSQMLEEMEADLAQLQGDSAKEAEEAKAMMAAKTEQIAAGKEKLDAMEAERAENKGALADAKENLEQTREQVRADVDFLRELRVNCQEFDKNFELRSKTRGQEILAVAETLAILTEDDSRELLMKSVKFLQVSSESQRRSAAVAFLRRSLKNPAFDADDLLTQWNNRRGSTATAAPAHQLSALAVSVQLDAFTKIKAMMDKMVAELQKEQEEEVAFKAECEKNLNQNEKETFHKNEQREDQENTIAKLTALIEKLNKEIEAHNAEIAENKDDILKAGEVREKENAEFQAVVADQRATQVILKKAEKRMQDFYGFLQQQPPVQFNAYKNNAGASPVIGLIQQIIEDSVTLEKEAMDNEQEAQANYEKFVADANATIKSNQEAVAAKTERIAQANEDMTETKENLAFTHKELDGLAQEATDLHGECDFVLKNFDIRQGARLKEIEAIQTAKGILSGAGGKGGIDSTVHE